MFGLYLKMHYVNLSSQAFWGASPLTREMATNQEVKNHMGRFLNKDASLVQSHGVKVRCKFQIPTGLAVLQVSIFIHKDFRGKKVILCPVAQIFSKV